MKTVGRWRVVLALLPTLVGVAACQTGDKEQASGEAVYGQPLAQQFHAAQQATREAGTAGFVATLTYRSAVGDAVHTTIGSQDYAAGSARGSSTLRVPTDFPEPAAEFLAEPGTTARQTLATVGGDVYVKEDAAEWLRFTPEAFNEFGDATSALSVHAAGDAAPYSGTLADLVTRAVPREKPKRDADGNHTYRVTVLPEFAAELLPLRARAAGKAGMGTEPVDMTVTLDAEGRLARATADLDPLLSHMDLIGVTGLQASYQLSAFGEPYAHPMPGEDGVRVEDARKVLALTGTLKGGQCAAMEAALDSRAVVRPVDCAKAHDMRVFAQVAVDRTVPGRTAVKSGLDYAREECEREATVAPKEWFADSRRGVAWAVTGRSEEQSSTGGGRTDTTVTGAYTCYVPTS
ncbi:hypothetical protein AB0K02_15570 [Streptomyces sp. NPDC049597]|uniref:hypothetical protein n=1 Tax=Streptomyces sp. NPDC049597 TaxID=3155276 RepID=UPI003427C195